MATVLLVFVLCGFVQPSGAVAELTHPPFAAVRDEVMRQQILASNAPAPDKRLLASLRKALTTIDRTKSNHFAHARSLGLLAQTLNRTVLSNVFMLILEETVEGHIACLMEEGNSLSNRLAAAAPSKTQAHAQKSVSQFRDALTSADASADVIVAARFLSLAARKLAVATRLTAQAENVVPSGFYFTATTSPGGDFNGFFGGRLAGVVGFFNGFLTLAVVDPVPLEPQRDFMIAALWPGNISLPHTFSLGYTHATYRIGKNEQVWQTTDEAPGTLTITEFNTTEQIIAGTFSFIAPADPDSAATGTVTVSNGRFRVKYQLLGP